MHLRLIIFLVFSMLVTSCGFIPVSKPVMDIDPNSVSGTDSYATIVQGVKLLDGNIIGVGFVGYVDGTELVNKDIFRKGYKLKGGAGPSPKTISMPTGDTVLTDAKGKGYRVWKLSKNDVSKGGKAVFYVYQFRNENNELISGHRKGVWNTYLTPVSNTSMAFSNWGEDSVWKFYKVAFTIDKPGIYYLGDLEVGGQFNWQDKEYGEIKYREMKAEYVLKSAKGAQLGLSSTGKNVFSLADKWSEVSGREYKKYSSGSF